MNGDGTANVERALVHLYIGKQHHIVALPELEERVRMVAAEFGPTAESIVDYAFNELKNAGLSAGNPLEITPDNLRSILAPIFVAVEAAAAQSS